MEATWLQNVWFLLLGALVAGYAVLDGFDLGVGMLHMMSRDEGERRAYIQSIAPFWDGNEVWLLTAGGALFAAFPVVYSTVFSALYLPFMVLLIALIARAVAIEYRNKLRSLAWRRLWDFGLGIGSLLPSFLYGVAVGNLLRGLPMDDNHWYTGGFLDLLNPFALAMGMLQIAAFVTHGALYLVMKTDGRTRTQAKKYAIRAWVIWVMLTGVSLVLFLMTSALRPVLSWVWVGVPLILGLLLATLLLIRRDKEKLAFLASSASLVSMVGLIGLTLYPRLLPALGRESDLQACLTIMNASSSEKALMVMLIIAAIGMPIVVTYTIFIYRVFRGKVVSGADGY